MNDGGHRFLDYQLIILAHKRCCIFNEAYNIIVS